MSFSRRLKKRADVRVGESTIFQAKFQGEFFCDSDASSAGELTTVLRSKIQEATETSSSRRKDGWKAMKVLVYVSKDRCSIVDRVSGENILSFRTSLISACTHDGDANVMFAILARQTDVSMPKCFVFKSRGYAHTIVKAVNASVSSSVKGTGSDDGADATIGSTVAKPRGSIGPDDMTHSFWECTSCGTRNINESNTCIMCFASNPQLPLKQAVTVGDGAVGST